MNQIIIDWYNVLCESWGLETLGQEPDENADVIYEDFIFRDANFPNFCIFPKGFSEWCDLKWFIVDYKFVDIRFFTLVITGTRVSMSITQIKAFSFTKTTSEPTSTSTT